MNRNTPRRRRAWRPNAVTVFVAILVSAGIATTLYPVTAAWLSSINQAAVIDDARQNLDDLTPRASEQLRLAHRYNDALTAGVRLDPGATVPVGTGNVARQSLEYRDMLTAGPDGLMGRVRVPSIDVDIPLYHGTSDETLLRGAGHLEGTHLPVGGAGTHSVVTAHRGLANATMFTDLDQVREGDLITVETLTQVSVYRVDTIEVIEPHDSQSLRAEVGRDLLTLITCTPLGINSHRILVTGERVTPAPPAELEAALSGPENPMAPFWILVGLVGLTGLAIYFVHRGFVDAAIRTPPVDGASTSAAVRSRTREGS